MLEKPSFLQGVFAFEGHGLQNPDSLQPVTRYKVPFDKRSQIVYFRAGNASAELVYFLMTQNEKPMRYFPVGAKESVHVPLAVVEDLTPETVVDVLIAAPEGLKGLVVLDIGFMEF